MLQHVREFSKAGCVADKEKLKPCHVTSCSGNVIINRGINTHNNYVMSWFQTFAVFCMLYVFFWAIPRRRNFIWRRCGRVCSVSRHRQIDVEWPHLPAYEDGTECSETSAYKIQTPGNLPRRKHTIFRTQRKFEIKFRRQRIVQKKTYNIQNTAKVWNKIQTPKNCPEENIQYSEHSEILK
jgi:hypothetical protein